MEGPTPDSSFDALADLMRGGRTLALSGAGISTESGIPDYRGASSAPRRAQPMSYQEFVRNPTSRARYWARSAIGWPRVASARPNAGHLALARLERAGALTGVITQNVDGLHQAAGSRAVIELHGSLAGVRCVDCGAAEARDHLQGRLVSENSDWRFDELEAAPDGDAQVTAELAAAFRVPGCLACGGTLRPDVVFFGENVPAARVQEAMRMVDGCELLLVVGSSLAVYSGFRFVQRAAERGIPVAVVNLGPTRADAIATIRIEGRLGEVLPSLEAAVTGGECRRDEGEILWSKR